MRFVCCVRRLDRAREALFCSSVSDSPRMVIILPVQAVSQIVAVVSALEISNGEAVELNLVDLGLQVISDSLINILEVI